MANSNEEELQEVRVTFTHRPTSARLLSGLCWSHLSVAHDRIVHGPKELDHWVRLNQGFQLDLHWWAILLDD